MVWVEVESEAFVDGGELGVGQARSERDTGRVEQFCRLEPDSFHSSSVAAASAVGHKPIHLQ